MCSPYGLRKDLRLLISHIRSTMKNKQSLKLRSAVLLSACVLGFYTVSCSSLHKDKGLPVDFPETGFKWNQLGRLAQKFYADYADLSYPVLFDRFAATKDRILAVIEKTDNEDLYGKPWYETYTLGRMIQFNTASPFDNARKRLRRWKKEKGLA